MKPIVSFINLVFLSSIGSLLLYSTTCAQPKTIIVGFLEDNRVDRSYSKEDLSTTRIIRTAFSFENGIWKKSEAIASEMQWTIAFNGKIIGEVSSRPNSYTGLDGTEFTHEPLKTELPVRDVASDEFAGWWSGKVRRPLVVVSRNYFQDPDQWKVAKLSNDIMITAIEKLRKINGEFENCDSSESNKIITRHFNFMNSDIVTVKTYRSKQGDSLVGLKLSSKLYKCDDFPGEGWKDHWFFVPKIGAPIFLGRELVPLDAGDYNGDGRPEFVFFINRYNEDGYALFWNGFTEKVETTWHYH